MLNGSAKDIYGLYAGGFQAWFYHGKDKNGENGKIGMEYMEKAEEKLKEIMGKQGYPIEKKQVEEHEDEYIHFTLGNVCVHQLPFLDEWNMSIEKYIFDKEGRIKTWREAKNMIREDVGEEEFDLSELDDDIRVLVEAVKKEEDIEIQDVEGDSVITITAGEEEFTILKGGEEQGEEMARDYLEDGDLWKMAVEGDNTTSGLDDWIDDILETDGWESEICCYDGQCRYAKTEEGKEVVYYQSN